MLRRLRTGLLSLGALALVACAVATAPDTRRSGFVFMGASTQAMQRDDMQNPGMLWVQDGADLWQRKSGRRAVACADCHGDAAVSMRGVAARYPVFDVVIAMARWVRPWKLPLNTITCGRFVACLASFTAASVISAPEFA